MKERPNILFITTDQHNAGVLGCYGNSVVRTPHIDSLARDGVVFDSAYTPHAVCTPARTTILTGLTGRHHGVTYNINLDENRPDTPGWAGLSADIQAFPELLNGREYTTSLFGKLHTKQQGSGNFGLQTMKLAEGKGQFVDYGTAPDDYRRFLQDKGHPPESWRTWESSFYRENGYVTSPLPADDTIDSWTATAAAGYLKKAAEPFFCWLSFSGPHTPWDPPKPFDTLYRPDEIPLPSRRRGELEEKHPLWVDMLARSIPATPPRSMDPELPGGVDRAYSRVSDEKARRMLAAYYGQVSLIDLGVGRVLDSLREKGVFESTLIVFTSDHGDYLGNNWAWYKYGAQYDSLSRIPLVFHYPSEEWFRGTRRNELVSLTDLASTFLEAAGTGFDGVTDGDSLLPLMRPGHDRARAAGRTELLLEGGTQAGSTALVSGDWKLIRWNDGFTELYDRHEDPGELHNLADRKKSMVQDLCERMEEVAR